MDISGIVQSYGSRTTSTAGLTRAIAAPHYVQTLPYSQPTASNMVVAQQSHLQNPFSYNYSAAPATGLVPAFAMNYIQQRPASGVVRQEHPYSPNANHGYVDKQHSQSPVIKAEPQWNMPPHSGNYMACSTKPTVTTTANSEATFGTEVDTLMKAIQAKSQPGTPPVASIDQGKPVDDTARAKGGRKRYLCPIPGCTKGFVQKTHLDIHERAHTGVKPYLCKEPNCGRSFSQLGNLKTHERRHTGERPYPCEICGKRFAQRGNVRAHKIVHDQAKPYLCRLDDCGKQFTQLGNLKSHQNKFHIATIRNLTNKFASGNIVHPVDKELWEYFANLYKNSNKGIKGRGKDRKVGTSPMSFNSGMRRISANGTGGYGMTGPGRGLLLAGMMSGGMPHGVSRGDGGQYEMFDVDSESQSGSHCGSGDGSSVGTVYDDAHSEVYEDARGVGHLAFGDRIY